MITKQCTECGQVKPLSEFHKKTNSRDGHSSKCKTCRNAKQAEYKKTDAGKATQKRYNNSEKGREAQRKRQQKPGAKAKQRAYRRSEQGREKARNFRKTEKYKIAHRRAAVNYRRNSHERFLAQDRVNKAVIKGTMPPPASLKCQWKGCKDNGKDYHHVSYRPGDWYDVIPLCHKHHNIIHGNLIP